MTDIGVFSFKLHLVRGWRGVPPGVKGFRGNVQDKTTQYFKDAGVIANVVTIPTEEANSQLLHTAFASSEDEVEKLAYQLNEEAERTERPIRRLSKVMSGSTCADMQVDVMGECLSSIKHVVGVRSVFLAKRLHAV
ncbi:uncharacterized protein TNCV_2109561 [Trichonephila clavipes]|nr:uncharacterized protein TNCV_2109561 [Trichonephila clavipes]